MVILLPYSADAHAGTELRYTLRSICLYQPHSRLIVIGDKPLWYTGEYLSATDTPGRPEFNVASKLLAAGIDDDFILWQDDIFKLNNKPVVNCYCDTLKHALTERRHGRFREVLCNTYNTFPDGMYYGGHTPMIMNGVKLKQAIAQHWTRDLIPKSLYGNFTGGGISMPDCKMNGRYVYEDALKFIRGKDYFSTGMSSLWSGVIKLLNELYPDKCIYES